MNKEKLDTLFSEDTLESLFPASRTNEFFEALFGDASEGAYDIKLRYHGFDERGKTLRFYLDLHERPGCCLVCNLTYGLPDVFSRHPVINVEGLVREIEKMLDGEAVCTGWKLGTTEQSSKSLHSIPLSVKVEEG
ncbi:MAG TPA: pancreas/duodenum homeobox protein 1 [Desulfobulbus sp.]|nr:pancreas/duodenum homeobox protein 1 [Desulfobulbus sp.]